MVCLMGMESEFLEIVGIMSEVAGGEISGI